MPDLPDLQAELAAKQQQLREGLAAAEAELEAKKQAAALEAAQAQIDAVDAQIANLAGAPAAAPAPAPVPPFLQPTNVGDDDAQE